MKKTITILLVLTVLVNAIGFGFLNVRASAELVTAAAVTVLSLVGGFVIGGLSGLLSDEIGDNAWKFDKIDQNVIAKINDNAIQRGEVIQLVEQKDVNGNYSLKYFVPAEGLDEATQEFADYLCNSLNKGDALNAIQGYKELYSNVGGIDAATYCSLKNDVTNAFYDYVSQKEMVAAQAELGSELSEATGMQPYDFSFIGPILPYQQPMFTSSGFVDRNVNGYLFYSPVRCDRADGQSSTPITSMFGEKADYSGDAERGYVSFVNVPVTGCGYGDYIIYGGKIYCRSFYSGSERDSFDVTMSNYPGAFDVLSSFVDENGVSLTAAGCTSYAGCAYGLYVKQDPDAPAIPTTHVKESDLQSTTSIGGASIPGMPTSAEEQIRKAIASGVLTTNPMLQVNEQGEIVGADGLTMEQIQNIVNNITNNTTTNNTTNVDLSNVEEYLAAIKQACIDSGVDIGKIERIINNVNSKIKDYSGNLGAILSAINGVKELEDGKLTTIADQTAAIAEALTAAQTITAEKKLDIDTPSSITDKFPFSLPFDVYNTFNLLSAEPVAPKFSFPLKMDGVFEYNIDVDLSEYEWIAVIVRWLIFAACVVGLILATNKLIGRG